MGPTMCHTQNDLERTCDLVVKFFTPILPRLGLTDSTGPEQTVQQLYCQLAWPPTKQTNNQRLGIASNVHSQVHIMIHP